MKPQPARWSVAVASAVVVSFRRWHHPGRVPRPHVHPWMTPPQHRPRRVRRAQQPAPSAPVPQSACTIYVRRDSGPYRRPRVRRATKRCVGAGSSTSTSSPPEHGRWVLGILTTCRPGLMSVLSPRRRTGRPPPPYGCRRSRCRRARRPVPELRRDGERPDSATHRGQGSPLVRTWRR